MLVVGFLFHSSSRNIPSISLVILHSCFFCLVRYTRFTPLVLAHAANSLLPGSHGIFLFCVMKREIAFCLSVCVCLHADARSFLEMGLSQTLRIARCTGCVCCSIVWCQHLQARHTTEQQNDTDAAEDMKMFGLAHFTTELANEQASTRNCFEAKTERDHYC